MLQGPMGAPGWDSGDRRPCGHEQKALLGPTARVCTLGDADCRGEWRSLLFPGLADGHPTATDRATLGPCTVH